MSDTDFPSDEKIAGDDFLMVLDGMIESTVEFIRDDDVGPWNDNEGRLTDLGCLVHVRDLFTETFRVRED